MRVKATWSWVWFRLSGGRFALVGHDAQMTCIDLQASSIRSTKKLGGVFYEFLPIGNDEEVVLIHEIGALRVRSDASTVWAIDTDIIATARLNEHNLILELMDPKQEIGVDLNSGRVVEVKT
jgi:hypothetical protein